MWKRIALILLAVASAVLTMLIDCASCVEGVLP